MCETEVVASLWSESQRTGNNQCAVHLEDLEKSGSGVGAGGKVQGLLEGRHAQEMRLQAWDSLTNGTRSETPLTGEAPLKNGSRSETPLTGEPPWGFTTTSHTSCRFVSLLPMSSENPQKQIWLRSDLKQLARNPPLQLRSQIISWDKFLIKNEQLTSKNYKM